MLLERSLTEIFVGDDFGRTPEDELEIQISRLERELSEAEAAREAAVRESQAVMALIEPMKQCIEELQAQLSTSLAEVERLRASTVENAPTTAITSSLAFPSHLEPKQDEEQRSKGSEPELRERINKLDQQLQEQREEYQHLAEDREKEHQQALVRLTAQMNLLHTQLDQLHEQQEQEREHYEHALKEREKHVQCLQHDLELQQLQQVSQPQETVSQYQQEDQNSIAKVENQDAESLQRLVVSIQRTLTEREEELDSLRRERNIRNETINSLKAENAQNAVEREQLQREISRLSEDDGQKTELARRQVEEQLRCQGLQEELERLSAMLRDREEELTDLQSEFQLLGTQHSTLLTQYRALTAARVSPATSTAAGATIANSANIEGAIDAIIEEEKKTQNVVPDTGSNTAAEQQEDQTGMRMLEGMMTISQDTEAKLLATMQVLTTATALADRHVSSSQTLLGYRKELDALAKEHHATTARLRETITALQSMEDMTGENAMKIDMSMRLAQLTIRVTELEQERTDLQNELDRERALSASFAKELRPHQSNGRVDMIGPASISSSKNNQEETMSWPHGFEADYAVHSQSKAKKKVLAAKCRQMRRQVRKSIFGMLNSSCIFFIIHHFTFPSAHVRSPLLVLDCIHSC